MNLKIIRFSERIQIKNSTYHTILFLYTLENENKSIMTRQKANQWVPSWWGQIWVGQIVEDWGRQEGVIIKA